MSSHFIEYEEVLLLHMEIGFANQSSITRFTLGPCPSPPPDIKHWEIAILSPTRY
jgi:hypothetical protein